MKHNKKTLISAGILALALVIAFFFAISRKHAEAPLEPLYPSIPTIESPKRISHRVNMMDSMMPSYTESYMKYYKGNILQFNSNCQSRPYSLAIANGSQLLLDNRSNNSEIITIGDNKYSLDPYGYQIITVSVPKIPETFTVDCKVSQNVSTLIVE